MASVPRPQPRASRLVVVSPCGLGVVPVAFEMAGVVMKITDDSVRWLRKHKPAGVRLRRIARAFGVSERYAFAIIYGNARPRVPRKGPPEQLAFRF